jgi:predicted AAA+ superfamily ATPase
MIDRLLKTLLQKRLSQMPAVALLGPRQCGKTTLAKSCGGIYLDIEQEKGRTHLDLGWEGFVTGNELIILDEAQTFPEVFQKLRGAIDEERGRNGRFLLLGSVSPSLMLRVSESLAGRLGILELTPLLLPEIGFERLDDLWLTGGYPDGGIISSQDFPNWENDYLRLMAERDLPTWGLKASPRMTERLLKMTAALDAQPLNLSQLGQSLGISHPTVRSYLDFLEGAYLLRSLPPFHANIRKRLIKAPRLYWRDTGLLHSLMGVKTFEQLLDQPWVGASWEGFVIEQIISLYGTLGKDPEYYYFRTSDGHEIDLIVEFANERIGIEIKCTSSPSLQDFRRLKKTAEMCDCAKTYLISRTSDPLLNESGGSVNLSGFLRMIMEVSK